MTYITCKTCSKRFKKAHNHYRSKSVDHNCATCVRRLRNGGHLTQKGPTGPGGQKDRKKTGAKRTSNSIPRAPQGDE